MWKQVKDDVRAAVLNLIEKEREGEMVDRDLLKQVVDVSTPLNTFPYVPLYVYAHAQPPYMCAAYLGTFLIFGIRGHKMDEMCLSQLQSNHYRLFPSKLCAQKLKTWFICMLCV